MTGEVQFLGAINGLPPTRLGWYLEQYGTDSTQLQRSLGTLERKLRPPTT